MKETRVSAELFTIPLQDEYLVYAPLRQAAFITNAHVVNFIAGLQDRESASAERVPPDLVEFLRSLEIIDAAPEHPPLTTFKGTPKPTMVTLFLTTACNLRCTYCYASAGDTPTRVMTTETACKGIDHVIANAVELNQPGIEIAYHGGGEPTVNWRTLTESFAYAAERTRDVGLTVFAAMATNGVLTDHKIDWVIENLGSVSLSFDGLPAVHDANRIGLRGQPSSAQVIHTIQRFDSANFSYGLRLTVTLDNIPRMEDSIRFICQNFRPNRIQVEPAYQLGRWRDAPSAETAGFIAGFRAAQRAAHEYGQEITFSAARLGSLSNHFCGVTQDSFCLTADGNVSACYETFLEQNEWASTFFYGRYDQAANTYRFNLPVLDNLRRQSVEHRTYCQGCFAKWTCGGDCLHKSLNVNGAGEFQGTDRCHIIRELTKDQILTKIIQAGGYFWHEERSESSVSQGKELL